MNRKARRAAEKRAKAADGPLGRLYISIPAPAPLPSYLRFGEPLAPEHEQAAAAIGEALARHGARPADPTAIVVVAAPINGRIVVTLEAREQFAAKLVTSGHPDVAAAIRRPTPPGAVRTLMVSTSDSYQTGAAFWPSKPINSGTRGLA